MSLFRQEHSENTLEYCRKLYIWHYQKNETKVRVLLFKELLMLLAQIRSPMGNRSVFWNSLCRKIDSMPMLFTSMIEINIAFRYCGTGNSLFFQLISIIAVFALFAELLWVNSQFGYFILHYPLCCSQNLRCLRLISSGCFQRINN